MCASERVTRVVSRIGRVTAALWWGGADGAQLPESTKTPDLRFSWRFWRHSVFFRLQIDSKAR